MDDLVQADASGRHALGIQLDLKLPEVPPEPLHGRDAGDRQQPVLDVELGEIAQAHQIGGAGVRFERELEDLVETSGEARDERRLGARRQLAGGLAHAFGDELP